MRAIRLDTIKKAIPINIQLASNFYLPCVENEVYPSDLNTIARYIKETYNDKMVYIIV